MQNNNEAVEVPLDGAPEANQIQEVLPLELSTSTEMVRGDVNLKRFANFIFPHHRTKDLHRVRTFTSELTAPGGKPVTQKIVIEPVTDGRAYTTFTQRVYYALVLLWYEKGKPDGSVTFSYRELARKLNITRSWSGQTVRRLKQEIDCLRKTNIDWILAFETQDRTRKSERGFHIIEGFEQETIEERLMNGSQFEVNSTIRFHQRIRDNIIANVISPVNFSVLLSFRSSVSEMFYMRIDSILATTGFCHWTSMRLLEDLQLSDSAEYRRNASKRKRLLEKIAREVNLKPLSTGEIILATVEQTADGKDTKIVCTKAKQTEADLPERRNLPVANHDPEIVEYLASEIATAVGYGEENANFYRKLARHYPREVVYRVLAEFRTERPAELKNPGGFFSDKFHRVAHQAGFEWIKECDSDCPRRPENALL